MKEGFRLQASGFSIVVEGNAIFGLKQGGGEATPPPNRSATEVHKQLAEYLAGKRTKFDLKLAPKGTVFQQAVWKELLKIPYGQTRSYKELAIAIGKPKAARAVGMALNKNPIPLIIPCHRVIGSNGSLTGFALGLETKRWLLEMEQQT